MAKKRADRLIIKEITAVFFTLKRQPRVMRVPDKIEIQVSTRSIMRP